MEAMATGTQRRVAVTADPAVRRELQDLRRQVRYTNTLLTIVTAILVAPIVLSVLMILSLLGCVTLGAARSAATLDQQTELRDVPPPAPRQPPRAEEEPPEQIRFPELGQ